LLSAAAMAQSYPAARIQNLIESYQKDPRGPYKDIRWFCDDGSIIAPKESCPDGGVQRARYKEEVERLAETEHLFLGQILATTSRNAFWDAANNHSRLKQYQLERYLQKVDDGWVNRKAQYYRGAYQIEDEMEWGQDFFRWLLNYETALSQNFFLIRQAARDLPHGQDTDRSQRIRALSKVMAEAYPQFMDLRIKLHGQPDASDLAAVQAFDKKHHHELPADQQKNMQQLIEDLSDYYAPVDATQLDKLIKKIPAGRDLRQQLEDYITSLGQFNQQQIGVPTFLQRTADALLNIRQSITEINSRTARMAMIDLSLALEDIYLRELSQWTPNDLKSYAQKIYTNGIVAAGTGLLERWEWEALGPQLKNTPDDTDVAAQKDYLNQARRLVEWGAGMHRAVYQEEVDRFQSFEPKAYGFIDDRIRSSVLLDLGQTVGTFGESLQKEKSKSNHLLGLSNASHARGLNAGVAKGELVIIETATEDMPVDK
ncbi:MAG: phosphoenolpyruvate synthase, partial [Bacteroidota bacterium]